MRAPAVLAVRRRSTSAAGRRQSSQIRIHQDRPRAGSDDSRRRRKRNVSPAPERHVRNAMLRRTISIAAVPC